MSATMRDRSQVQREGRLRITEAEDGAKYRFAARSELLRLVGPPSTWSPAPAPGHHSMTGSPWTAFGGIGA
jgi:hypothetical protein